MNWGSLGGAPNVCNLEEGWTLNSSYFYFWLKANLNSEWLRLGHFMEHAVWHHPRAEPLPPFIGDISNLSIIYWSFDCPLPRRNIADGDIKQQIAILLQKLVRPATFNMLARLNSNHMTHGARSQQPISNGYTCTSSERYFDQYNVETAWGS